MSIEIIDKRDNTIRKVSEDYKIEYAGQSISLKECELDPPQGEVFGPNSKEFKRLHNIYGRKSINLKKKMFVRHGVQFENFIDKFVYNHCKPGTGKTKKIHQILDYCVENELKVMVCMPNHHLIEEFNDYKTYNSVHFYGKDHYCPKEGLDKYSPGCQECKISCMYKIQ